MLRTLAVWILVLASGAVFANDKWDVGSFGGDDVALNNRNELLHGASQVHDLQATGSPPDVDWIRLRVRARRSYEVRVSSTNLYWKNDVSFCLIGVCSSLERVDSSGNVLQDPASLEGSSYSVGVRWIAAATGNEYVRVTGPDGTALVSSDQYEITFLDTTYALPRFNNSSTQSTLLLVQNLRTGSVAGSVDFYDGGGTLLVSVPLTVSGNGVAVINTAAIPALVGQSGSARIAHTGGWGALAGKAVSVEPATGFAFDTPILPVPR
jgi:hypothetical protein